MDRLTEETQLGPFASLKDKAETRPGAFHDYDCLYAHMVAVTQLKAYEDTGLSPADIADLTARAEAAEAERDACKADLKSMADWYRDSVCDDGICGWCKQDADHGLDGDANECAGFYKNDCFEWRGQEAGKGDAPNE